LQVLIVAEESKQKQADSSEACRKAKVCLLYTPYYTDFHHQFLQCVASRILKFMVKITVQ